MISGQKETATVSRRERGRDSTAFVSPVPDGGDEELVVRPLRDMHQQTLPSCDRSEILRLQFTVECAQAGVEGDFGQPVGLRQIEG